MGNIIKIFDWLWRNKERMVLGVVVIVLCSRVYEVLHPKAPPAPPVLSFPKTQPPTDPGELQELGFPDKPTLPPPPPVPMVWKPLWERNPFWYNASVGQSDGSQGTSSRDQDIRLLRIMQLPNGKVRVQLQTGATKDWYDEGEQFEKYELISVDVENQQCEVYSEESRTRMTLRMQ